MYLLFAAALLLSAGSLFAGGSRSNAGTPQTGGLNPNINMASHEPIVFQTVRPTVVIQRLASYPPAEETWFFTYCKKILNIDFDIKAIDPSAWNEQKSLMLNTGDLPDLFLGCGFSTGDMMNYFSEQELGYDMTELINRYAPGIKDAFADEPVINKMAVTPDGKILSLPYYVDPSNSVPERFWIRNDWLGRVGLGVPKTLDEFRNTLIAFRDKITLPGNQKPVPYSGTWGGYGTRNQMAVAYGYTSAGNALSYNSAVPEYSYFPMSPHYRDYLTYLAGLYSGGLMDPDMFTQTSVEHLAKVSANLVGATGGAAQYILLPNEASDLDRKDYTYSAISSLTAPNRSRPIYAQPNSATPGTFVISYNSKHADVLVRFADIFFSWPTAGYLFSPYYESKYDFMPNHQNGMIFDLETFNYDYPDRIANYPQITNWDYWRMYGVNFEVIDVGYAYRRNYPEPFKQRFQGLEWNPQLEYFFNISGNEKFLREREFKGWQYSYMESNWDYGVAGLPNLYLSSKDNARINELATLINDLVDSTEAKIITGALPISAYDQLIADLRRLGVEEYMAIYRNAYQNYLKN